MNIVSSILGLGVTAGAVVTLLAVGCDQPLPKCALGHGVFGVKMNLISFTGDKAEGCADFTAEVFGASSYNDMQPSGYADLDKASIAIQSLTAGNARDRGEAAVNADGDPAPIVDNAHNLFALGHFSTPEPVDDFCSVPVLEAGQLTLPAIPETPDDPSTDDEDETVPAVPALDQKWAWSNVKVLMRADALGTQFSGDLTVTMNSCVAQYRAYGVFMYDNVGAGGRFKGVDCTGKDGNPNPDLCNSIAVPDAGLSTGSGISPETAVTCEPMSKICVPVKEPPSFL